MKAKNIHLFWDRTTTGQNGLPLHGSSEGYTEIVTSSGVYQGDHKTPQNWNYSCTTSVRFRTKDQGFHKFYSPWDTLQQKYENTFGSQSDLWLLPTWDRDSLYNSALDRLNEKVRGGLDLSISVFEIGQTKRMIKALAKVLLHAKRTLRRDLQRRMRKPGLGLPTWRDPTLDLANGYLQYTYGWKPLLSDVFNIAEESRRQMLYDIKHFYGKVRTDVNAPGTNIRRVNAFDYTPVRSDGQGKAACTIMLAFQPPNSAFDAARWSSLNPISIMWELIPYSFVVDWFYDVGSVLRNLETALYYGVNFKYGYVSELFIYDGVETVINGKYMHPFTFDGHEFKNVEGDVHHRRFIRSVLASYPFPRMPSIKADLGASRLLSAASLLRQFLPGNAGNVPVPIRGIGRRG